LAAGAPPYDVVLWDVGEWDDKDCRPSISYRGAWLPSLGTFSESHMPGVFPSGFKTEADAGHLKYPRLGAEDFVYGRFAFDFRFTNPAKTYIVIILTREKMFTEPLSAGVDCRESKNLALLLTLARRLKSVAMQQSMCRGTKQVITLWETVADLQIRVKRLIP